MKEVEEESQDGETSEVPRDATTPEITPTESEPEEAAPARDEDPEVRGVEEKLQDDETPTHAKKQHLVEDVLPSEASNSSPTHDKKQSLVKEDVPSARSRRSARRDKRKEAGRFIEI